MNDLERAQVNVTARAMVPATVQDVVEGYELPCLEVAGVQVYVYLHEDGALRVALHFDTADPAMFPSMESMRGCVPVKLDAGGSIVWEADASGAARCAHELAGQPHEPQRATRQTFVQGWMAARHYYGSTLVDEDGEVCHGTECQHVHNDTLRCSCDEDAQRVVAREEARRIS